MSFGTRARPSRRAVLAALVATAIGEVVGAARPTAGGFALAQPVVGAAQSCPQQDTAWFPDTGNVEGYTISTSNAAFCSLSLNMNVTLKWPVDTGVLTAAQVEQEINQAIPWIQESWSRYQKIFETSPGTIAAKNGPGSIVVAFFPGVARGGGTFGGIHKFYRGLGKSVLYMNLDPTAVSAGTSTPWPQLRAHTIAHEMFHAFHYQLRQAEFESPYKWLTESLADWGAKQVTRSAPPYTITGEYAYHRAMGRFFTKIRSGITSLEYSPHMFWHDLESADSESRVRAVVRAHLQSGAGADALHAADLEGNWHDFAKHLLHRDPWKRFTDWPQFPESWTLPASHTVRVNQDPYCSDPESLEMAKVSVFRVEIELDTQPEQLYLGASFGLRAGDTSGFEWSAALHPSHQEISLETDAANLLCFSNASPACEGASTLPPTTSIDLILSNRDIDKTLSPRLHVCTVPAEPLPR